MNSLPAKMMFFCSLMIGGKQIASQEVPRVLCVDIGGTRVKAAILYPGITLEELQCVSTVAFDSKEWLSEDLPRLFKDDIVGSLSSRIGSSYDQVSIGVRSPVMNGEYCVVPKEHLPLEMRKECETAAQRPVFLECDTGIWTHGALYWQSLIHQNIPFPCLGITLGTGVGVSLIFSPQDIVNIEISLIDSSFDRLLQLRADQPLKYEYDRPSPHDVLGIPYFNWRKGYDPQMIQDEYNARIIAFIKDMEEFLNDRQGVKIQSIMIGGGNSRWISQALEKACGKTIILLSPENVSRYGVSFDVISLLGCLRIRDFPPVGMLPSWEEMMPWYVK